ncbi:hypothetical protein PAAG_11102 [Paracoccidioides lutzii Pb01]|uniref:Uncharacterized protein n=1 Tax=Paracoccidioides lutzii (strain ATCC MYA-826 / Pb01) TaxID=502779 RepID=A0A0A2VMU6_PARBA|nr:hypothetical protein PAAG_11102 [Paracoccidioides lutzii Pb01]KGQ02149.1 hypothetical protein PAAG_11102 [Paracoccidioides lutzii Pb01]
MLERSALKIADGAAAESPALVPIWRPRNKPPLIGWLLTSAENSANSGGSRAITLGSNAAGQTHGIDPDADADPDPASKRPSSGRFAARLGSRYATRLGADSTDPICPTLGFELCTSISKNDRPISWRIPVYGVVFLYPLLRRQAFGISEHGHAELKSHLNNNSINQQTGKSRQAADVVLLLWGRYTSLQSMTTVFPPKPIVACRDFKPNHVSQDDLRESGSSCSH